MAEEKKTTNKTTEKKAATKKSTEKKAASEKKAEPKKVAEKKKQIKKTEAKTATGKNPKPAKLESKAGTETKKTSKSAAGKTKEPVTVKEEVKETAPLHPTLQKKKEAREAKAARKAANKIEEKKSRPNNILLAVLIFGILIGMFAFVGGYNYFKKPATIEKYVEDNGMAEMYGNFQYDDNTQVIMKAEGNTVKVVLRVAEDAPEDAVEQFRGEEGTKKLKDIGAYFITTFKPETRAFNATVKVAAKQGDETINYVKMSYKEAKQFVEDLLEESTAETEADAEVETEASTEEAAEAETKAETEAETSAE